MWHDYWFSGKSCTIWIAKAFKIVLLYNFFMICITDRNYSVFIRLIFNHDSLRSKHKWFLSCCKLSPVHWKQKISMIHWKRKVQFQSRKHQGLWSESRYFLNCKWLFRFQWTGLRTPTESFQYMGASLFSEKSIAISLSYKSKMCQIEQCVNYDLSCIQAFINTTAFFENLGSQLLLQSF